MSFFSRSEKKLFVLFHIGSGSIGGALVQMTPGSINEKPEILYTARETIILRKNAEGGKESQALKVSMERIVESIIKANQELLVHSGEKLNIMCVLSSPWYVSQTKIISIQHKDQILISKDFVDSLIAKEVESFKEDLNKKVKKGSLDENILIESHVVHVKLNGYPVSKPLGKKAETVEVAMIMSFAPQRVVQVMHEVVRKFVRVEKINFNTFSLAGFSIVRDIFPDIHNFIFTEIGGEVTDVTIAKKGILLETISLPVGSYTLVRSISESLNVLPDVAISYLSLDIEEVAHADLKSSIESTRESVRQKWIQSFGNALTIFSQEIFLPRDLFFISEQGTGDFFLNVIKKTEFKEIAFTTDAIRARLLSGHTLSDFVRYGEHVPRDSFLSLIALFNAKVTSSDV